MFLNQICCSLGWLLVAGTTVVDALARPQDEAIIEGVTNTPHRAAIQLSDLHDILPPGSERRLLEMTPNKPSTLRLYKYGHLDRPHVEAFQQTERRAEPEVEVYRNTTLAKRDIHLDDRSCPPDDWRHDLGVEVDGAVEMIAYASNMTADHPIWRKLIEPSQVNNIGAMNLFRNRLKGLSDRIADATRPIKLRCDHKDDPDKCTNAYTDEQDTIAWSDVKVGEISVCEAISDCSHFLDVKCVDDEHIGAYDSIATTIIHESIHVVFETDPKIWVRDIEYGWDDCISLAAGDFPEIATGATLVNVDTFALLISDLYWYDKCKGEKMTLNLD